MRPVQLKKWLRVAIPLLLVSSVSLVVFSSLYWRNDKSKTQNVQMQDFLKSQQNIQREQESGYKWDEREPKRRSKGITLAVVEEHHEGKHNRRVKAASGEK